MDGVGFSIWAEMAEVDPSVQLDTRQDVEKAGVQFIEVIALLQRSGWNWGWNPWKIWESTYSLETRMRKILRI